MQADRRYDIVRKESETAAFWLESAADLGLAKSRVKQLVSYWPGKYQVFDLETKQVVHTTSSPTAPEEMPLSNSSD